MHYTLKLSVCVLLFFMCGCAAMKPMVKFIDKNYETDSAVIKAEIPEFKNFPNKEFEEKLNDEYEKNFAAWTEDFLKQCGNEPVEKCEFVLTQEIKYNKLPFLSVVGEAYSFTGGVHGSSSRAAINVDANNGTELTLSDLFDDSGKAFLNRKLLEIEEKNPEEYHDLWERPKISDDKSFYLSDKGLVIYFPPYELSYYARGFVEFMIPYGELAGELRQEYIELANR